MEGGGNSEVWKQRNYGSVVLWWILALPFHKVMQLRGCGSRENCLFAFCSPHVMKPFLHALKKRE